MTTHTAQPAAPTSAPDPSVSSRLEVLRAEAQAEPDPSRKAKLLHAVGRMLDILENNDVAAANEYLAAFQTNRGQKGALFDLIGIYERRKSATNLAKLHQVEGKSAPDAEARASALLDLLAIRADLAGDPAGAQASLAEAIQIAGTHPDVALVAELAARPSNDQAELAERLRARIETTDDPVLLAELTIERADALVAVDRTREAIEELRHASARGAPAIRLALAMERLARRAGDRGARGDALERLGSLAASAIESAAEFDEPGVGPLLWEDALAARAWAVAAFRAAAIERAATSEPNEIVLALYSRALEIEPSAPWIRLERLAVARAAGRDDVVAADEEALADALGEGAIGAFVYHRLASRLERMGRADEANELRAEARALAPTSAVLAATDESGVRNRTHAARWFETLPIDDGRATSMRLGEAAFVADELLDDYGRARPLFERALETTRAKTPLLRALYGAALLRDDLATAGAALARMTDLDPESERRRRFDHAFLAGVSLDDPTPAIALARALLADPDESAAQVARAIGALADDHSLVEDAHLRLAELASSPDEKAAHHCAASRAASAAGALDRAERHAFAALDSVDGHAIAVAIIDALLRARNDIEGLAQLARRAAAGRTGEGVAVSDAARAALSAALAGRHDEASTAAERMLDAHPGSLTAVRVARFVSRSAANPALSARALAASVPLETPFSRARAALTMARDAMVAGREADAATSLGLALSHGKTAVDAAVGVTLLTDPPSALVRRASEVLRAAGIKDSDAWFPTGATEAPTESTDDSSGAWLDAAIAAPNDLDAERAVALAAERGGGPAAIASQVVRHLRDSSEGDVRDDLGLLVLRAASTEGAGELAAAIADISFGPDDDPTVRRSAYDSALRESSNVEDAGYSASLGRLFASMGRNADAVEYLDRAVRARPNDLGAWEALRIAARDAGKHERFVEACDALAAHARGDVRAELLEDAAAVLADSLKRPADALQRARAALEAAPDRDRAHQRAKSLLGAMKDDAGLAALAATRADSVGDVGSRVKQLFEAARHLRTAGDKSGALAPLERILDLDPMHAGALAMRAEISVALEQFADAVDSLRKLARADVPPAQRRVALLGAADFLERKLGKPDEALKELESIDALGLADPAILQRMAKIAEGDDRFDDALTLHGRVAASQALPLRLAESERAIARIRYKWKRDSDGAVTALRRALQLVPDDVDSATLFLHLVDDENERIAVARSVDAAVRAKLAPDSLSLDVLRKLLRVADMRGARDLTKLVLATLTALRSATDEERAREEDNTAIVRRVRPPATPITEQLEGLRVEHDRGPYAEIASNLFDLLVELDGLDVGRYGANKNEHLARQDPARMELADLALAFGVGETDAYPSAQLDSRKVIALPGDRGISFVVPKGIAIPLDPALRFDAGRLTWAIAHRTLPFVQRPPEEAAAILLGALDACDVPIGDAKSRSGVASWSKAISRVIARKQKKAVHDLGLALEDRGARAEAFCRAARQSSLRAGLLVSSDIDAALSVVLGTTPSLAATASTPEAADLVCFHLSSTSLVLRRELGLAS